MWLWKGKGVNEVKDLQRYLLPSLYRVKQHSHRDLHLGTPVLILGMKLSGTCKRDLRTLAHTAQKTKHQTLGPQTGFGTSPACANTKRPVLISKAKIRSQKSRNLRHFLLQPCGS